MVGCSGSGNHSADERDWDQPVEEAADQPDDYPVEEPADTIPWPADDVTMSEEPDDGKTVSEEPGDDETMSEEPGGGDDDTGDGDSLRATFYLDDALESMARANIAFNLPDSVMKVGESMTIQLLLDFRKETVELAEEIEEPGAVEVATVLATQVMRASLKGQGFTITPITSEEQIVSGRETTEWLWDLRAEDPGDHYLYLSLTAIVKFEGEDRKRELETFRRNIKVRISAFEVIASFIGSNWQWCCSTLIIPLIVYLLRRRKKLAQASD